MPDSAIYRRRSFAAMMLASAAACGRPPAPESTPDKAALPVINFVQGYGPIQDGEYYLPGIPDIYTQGINRRMFGEYLG